MCATSTAKRRRRQARMVRGRKIKALIARKVEPSKRKGK